MLNSFFKFNPDDIFYEVAYKKLQTVDESDFNAVIDDMITHVKELNYGTNLVALILEACARKQKTRLEKTVKIEERTGKRISKERLKELIDGIKGIK